MSTNSYKIKNSINLQPQATAPSNPVLGDIYCNAAGVFNQWNGTSWAALGGGSEVVVTGFTHGWTSANVGNAVRSSGTANEYALSKADTSDNAEAIGVITEIVSATSFKYIPSGKITGLTGLTAGVVYFVSDATDGLLTATEPTTVGSISKPMLIATSTTEGIVVNMRGSTIGGTNLYTSIPLNNNGTTNLQTITSATGTGGFIEGVIQILTTGTNYVTTFKAEFAVPVSGTDYPHTVTYGCDALPAGSSIGVTSGGVIQLTLPSITGFSSGTARFSMQAAAVGATLPLQISGALVNGPVLGSTSGTAIGAGMVGETKTAAAVAASTTNGVSGSVNSTNTLSLTAGVWMIILCGSGFVSLDVATGQDMLISLDIYNSSDASSIATTGDVGYTGKDAGGAVRPGAMRNWSGTAVAVVNISASKNYVGRAFAAINGGATGQITTQANGGLTAVRIA